VISLTSAQQALLLSNSVKKTWALKVYNGSTLQDTIPISKMVSDSLTIKEALCTSDKIDFSACEAATLTVQLADIGSQELKNKKLVISVSATDGTDTVNLDMGVFYIDDVVRQNGSWFYNLTAYDGMSLFDVNVSEWYNNLTFPLTLLQFRTELCSYVGVTQESVALPCDALPVTKTIDASDLTGRDVLKAICQINGRFGHFDRSGVLRYITLGNNSVITLDDAGTDHYKDGATHEDWTVTAYDSVTVQTTDDDVKTVYPLGGGDNTLSVSGNFLLYDLSTSDRELVAAAIYGAVSNKSYNVHTTPIQGRLWLEVGDKITITTDDGAFTSYILERTLTGFQGTTDELAAKGSDTESGGYSASEQIKLLKQRENSFERTIEKTVSKVSDLEQGMTEITQETGKLSVTVTTAKGTLSTVIDGTSWGATFTDDDGDQTSGLTFDFEKSQFVFNGSGQFTGEINVANKFTVSAAGDVTISGNSYIYGGRYYASEDGEGYMTMDSTGFKLDNARAYTRIKIGYSQTGEDAPYILLNSGENNSDTPGLLKKFSNGLWIGNSAPMEEEGDFTPKEGYQGIFIAFEDGDGYEKGQVYVVIGTAINNIYTGTAIAKFG